MENGVSSSRWTKTSQSRFFKAIPRNAVGVARCFASPKNECFRTMRGRKPQGAPRIPTLFRPPTNLNHFYPVAGAAGNRSTANGYTKICTTKRKG